MGGTPGMKGFTEEAEWALSRLVSRHAEYRQIALSGVAGPLMRGRHSAGRFRTRDANALVDFVAIAESFSIGRLIHIRSIAAGDLLTWDMRRKAWAKHATVDLVSFHGWASLMGFVEARNAIQHGLGRLTHRQLGKYKQEVLDWLDAANLCRNGDVLLLSERDVGRCSEVCNGFIEWLDSTAPTL
jgi:hypothetical protein